jgi:aspartate oxidase
MKHKIVIAGAGLGALTAACRLVKNGCSDIALYAPAHGGTPFIAAVNFVIPGSPYPDSPECYADDMLKAGYGLNDRDLVSVMVNHSELTYSFLSSLGVDFSRLDDGSLRRRHLSGSTYPRSLCSTKGLIGAELIEKLTGFLKNEGVPILTGYTAVALSRFSNRMSAIRFVDSNGTVTDVEAETFIAAWGGVGNLFGRSTYPPDENGRTLAIAFEAGVKLVDLEFLEYEPMVVMDPLGAVGEPCPTAMLGEGAFLLNKHNERFILDERPEGERGAPKTMLNRAIWKQVKAGYGSPHGGCWVDLRHIPVETLKLYPWFYNRLKAHGADPHHELIEVGPMAHSFSGGIKVDTSCRSNIENLYAVGEAAGGFHGACRMAGNAASQAAISGIIAADAISSAPQNFVTGARPVNFSEYRCDDTVREKFGPVIDTASVALGVYRTGPSLESSLKTLTQLLDDPECSKDTDTKLRAESVLLMVRAALERKESRGTHNRTDYPDQDTAQNHNTIFYKEG